MNKEIFKKNLVLLKKKNPLLAEKLNSVFPSKKYSVEISKKGSAFLSLMASNGTRKTLLSSYDPIQEAKRFLDSCPTEKCLNFLVMGLGLGYHVDELLKRIPESCQIIIVEKEIEVFYLAMSQYDQSRMLKHPGTVFRIGLEISSLFETLEDICISFVINGFNKILFKSLIEINSEYYENCNAQLDGLLKETKVNLQTKAAFSKNFYQNIFENWRNYLQSPGIKALDKYYYGFPAIVVSAGPSLDKNIHFLKKAAEESIIISVATALPAVLKLGVEPDFVVALDPDEVTLNSFEIKNTLKKTWLIFDPCVSPAVIELFPEKRIAVESGVYLCQWISEQYERKGFLGKTFSVAHAAFLLARLLGCHPIILTGQDLAFSGKRLHCNHSFYDQMHRDKIGFVKTLRIQEAEKYSQYSKSLVSVKNLFGHFENTTIALNMYRRRFAEEMNGNTKIYNATEGGIPIPGGKNISLREALYFSTLKQIPDKRKKNLAHLVSGALPERLNRNLRKQISLFRNILKDLEGIRGIKYTASDGKIHRRKKFVRTMETYYQKLMKEPDTLKLIQEYSYSEFMEWNRHNASISLKEKTSNEDDIIEEKFQRDERFLKVLEKSVQYLSNSFEKMAQE